MDRSIDIKLYFPSLCILKTRVWANSYALKIQSTLDRVSWKKVMILK